MIAKLLLTLLSLSLATQENVLPPQTGETSPEKLRQLWSDTDHVIRLHDDNYVDQVGTSVRPWLILFALMKDKACQEAKQIHDEMA